MAEQATGTAESEVTVAKAAVGHAGTPHAEHNPGRPISWIAVTIIVIGFIVGSVGMVPHMTWWLFWTGVGVTVVGCIVLAAARTLNEDWY